MSDISFRELLNAGVEIFGLACEHRSGREGRGICVSTHCEPHSEVVYVARGAHAYNESHSIRTESVKDLFLCKGDGIQLHHEILRLSDFILGNFPDELGRVGESESAADAAIRILGYYRNHLVSSKNKSEAK